MLIGSRHVLCGFILLLFYDILCLSCPGSIGFVLIGAVRVSFRVSHHLMLISC
ncbi:hypothetical protein HanXRQr2_Chr07g0303371 [Helianthus annuus]|uniref:Uncharacterized protein n=1 Tax=Helianthus annuus TaxID=4232 RepID=A0A251UCU3_HELAN|nr:hypothetical protein HanXRQr2_Chr07g0303371 [Helianthus annuus]KAJ0905408.1 hypothetical protein HanPSC8_Chr07g0293651 [Helianthus annuus]